VVDKEIGLIGVPALQKGVEQDVGVEQNAHDRAQV
jgi:hypothetical protein